MPHLNEIRADYNAQTITVYGAFSAGIARPALAAQRFVPPFSFYRMTWVKPSFLWLMERSNWAQKTGQEHILAIRIRRSGWEKALAQGVLTSYTPGVHANPQSWHRDFEQAIVHVQWDPERSIRGADLGYNSIQVGLSRHIIEEYVETWIAEIQDVTPLVKKLHALMQASQVDKAKKLLPAERVYPVTTTIARRLNMKTGQP